jgi:hypothetical protein
LLIVVDKIVGGNFVGGGEVKGNETLLRFDNLVRFEQRLFKILNYKISFVERAKLAMENLSKQQPISLEKALKQVQWLKEMSQTKQKKQKD